MQIETGSHARNPWWYPCVLLLGAVVSLPGAAWVAAQETDEPLKRDAVTPLHATPREEPPEPLVVRVYDVHELLKEAWANKTIEQAMDELTPFVQSAIDRRPRHLANKSLPPHSDIEGDFATLPTAERIEVDSAGGKLIGSGGISFHDSIRAELDRLKKYGTSRLLIETRLISIPADLLKKLELDWRLEETSDALTIATSGFRGSDHSHVTPASAMNLSDQQAPLLTAQMDAATLQRLLDLIQGNAKSNVMGCPQVMLFNGLEATIREGIERPFLIGMRSGSGNEDEPQQPVIRVIPEGTMLSFRPELQDDQINLQCTLQLSRLQEVGTFTYRRTGQSEDEGTTLQVPTVASSTYNYRAVDMPLGHSLVMATPRPGMHDEVAIVVITPQKIHSTSPHDPSRLHGILQKAIDTRAKQKIEYDKYSRVPILGATTSGGPAVALDPPSHHELMMAVAKIPDAKAFVAMIESDPKNNVVDITKEKIADYVDPPRHYPLIGPAQLHHAHYKCTIFVSTTNHQSDVEPYASRVVYVDHNHFHLVGDLK